MYSIVGIIKYGLCLLPSPVQYIFYCPVTIFNISIRFLEMISFLCAAVKAIEAEC